jgi:hypothetical protein
VQPQNGRAGDAGVREFPPYTDEYEAIYRKNIAKIKDGTFPIRSRCAACLTGSRAS